MSVTPKALINSKYATAGAGADEYTVPASTKTLIDKFTATNNDGSTRTLSIWIVPQGDSVGNANKVVSSVSIASGDVADLSYMKNQILNTGDKIVVAASSGSAICIRCSGREST